MISVRNRCRLATANEDRPRLLAMRSSRSPPARPVYRETGPEARRAASWSASSQESLLGHAGHAASGDDQMVDGPDVHQVQGILQLVRTVRFCDSRGVVLDRKFAAGPAGH